MSGPWSQTKASRRILSPDEEWAQAITKRIVADCHPWQRDAVIDPAKRISLLVGRGGAKTTTFRARAIIKLINLPKQYIGYAATSKDQARDLNWNKIKDVCEAYEIRSDVTSTVCKVPDVSLLDTRMELTCNRTGSLYKLRGVEDRRDAEKFRGFPQAEFQVDEAGSQPPPLLEYLLNSCVAPRLGEALALPPMDDEGNFLEPFGARGGCLAVGSTPPSHLLGEFYEVTRIGSKRHRAYRDRERDEYKNWKGYSSHEWTLKDVVELPDADKYPALVANWQTALDEKEEKGWSDDHPVWMREYLGKWAADNTTTVFRYRPHVDGQPWNQWDPLTGGRVEGPAALRAAIAALPDGLAWHYVYAADSGTRDPFALNVFAFAPDDKERRIFHVFCFERTGVLYARLLAQMLFGTDEAAPNGCCSPDNPKGLLGVTGWPVGQVIDADQAYIDELANVYGFRFAKAEKNPNYKFGAIELCNGDFIEGFIKILKGSQLEAQLLTLQWKPDDFGNPREDKTQANHGTDCLIYGRRLIAHMFETGTVSQDSAPRNTPAADISAEMMDDDPGAGWTDSLLSAADWGDLGG